MPKELRQTFLEKQTLSGFDRPSVLYATLEKKDANNKRNEATAPMCAERGRLHQLSRLQLIYADENRTTQRINKGYICNLL
jgi:hypothetical protein